MANTFDLSVYLVTDTRLCGTRGVAETVRQALNGGVTLVQLRDPDASTQDLVTNAQALLAILRPKSVPLIINDRVDVALAVGADGVHLGQDDMPAQKARALLGEGKIIGLSIGTLDELAASQDDLPYVDYVGIGPIRGTGTKPGAGEAIGVQGFKQVSEQLAVPTVAIGGLRASDATELKMAGASGVAVVSAICGSSDPAEAARALRKAVDA